MKCARYGLIAILLSIVVLPLSARAVPLDPPMAPIRQDGLLFSNFSAEFFVFGPGSPQDRAEFDVSGITVNGASGLRIAPGGSAPTNAGAPSGIVLGMGFDVMALNPHQPIHGVTVTIPEIFLTGGSSSVFASAGPAGVSVSGPGLGAPNPIEGSVSATGALESDMRRLHIDARVEVLTDSLAGGAFASAVEVTFVQSVPEPSIVLLLVFGAGLMTAMAHKVSRA